MKYLKKSSRSAPKLSLVLVDWSVRESFHLLDYLSKQSLPRDQFEVIIVEYYSTVSAAIKPFENQVDTWILLEMPTDSYYHKHLMYNVGIGVAQGDIVVICDSDAMAKPSFLQSIVEQFEKDENIFLHLDQFRNNRKDLYPFCYPSFSEVIGEGCINHVNGKTTGLATDEDIIHLRNYGACFCAKRADLIRIGGADEHIDFVGHICGPYDLSFRLINLGKKEVWHQEEFLYHTWHPGQSGFFNYEGPHEGRQLSTTALEAIFNRRVFPHVKNKLFSTLNADNAKLLEENVLKELAISNELLQITNLTFLNSQEAKAWAEKTRLPDSMVASNSKTNLMASLLASIYGGFIYMALFWENFKRPLKRFYRFKKPQEVVNKAAISAAGCGKRNYFFFSEKLLRKFKFIFLESAYLRARLLSLLSNLKKIEKDKDFILLISGDVESLIVRVFLFISGIKNIRIISIKNVSDLGEKLNEFNSLSHVHQLGVSSPCYMKYSSVLFNYKENPIVIV